MTGTFGKVGCYSTLPAGGSLVHGIDRDGAPRLEKGEGSELLVYLLDVGVLRMLEGIIDWVINTLDHSETGSQDGNKS